jgi:putative nucleotide binding protein
MPDFSRQVDKFKAKKIEYYGYVLDVFEDERTIRTFEFKGGRRIERKVHIRGRIGQVIGEQYFMLFEVLFKPEAQVNLLDRIYIGPGPKARVSSVIQRIGYDMLTSIAKGELENAIAKIIMTNEGRWLEFMNKSGPITHKLHALELLPNIGKKKMWHIINERNNKEFVSFRDFFERTGVDPVKALTGRIIEELIDGEKYYLFVHKKR